MFRDLGRVHIASFAVGIVGLVVGITGIVLAIVFGTAPSNCATPTCPPVTTPQVCNSQLFSIRTQLIGYEWNDAYSDPTNQTTIDAIANITQLLTSSLNSGLNTQSSSSLTGIFAATPDALSNNAAVQILRLERNGTSAVAVGSGAISSAKSVDLIPTSTDVSQVISKDNTTFVPATVQTSPQSCSNVTNVDCSVCPTSAPFTIPTCPPITCPACPSLAPITSAAPATCPTVTCPSITCPTCPAVTQTVCTTPEPVVTSSTAPASSSQAPMSSSTSSAAPITTATSQPTTTQGSVTSTNAPITTQGISTPGATSAPLTSPSLSSTVIPITTTQGVPSSTSPTTIQGATSTAAPVTTQGPSSTSTAPVTTQGSSSSSPSTSGAPSTSTAPNTSPTSTFTTQGTLSSSSTSTSPTSTTQSSPPSTSGAPSTSTAPNTSPTSTQGSPSSSPIPTSTQSSPSTQGTSAPPTIGPNQCYYQSNVAVAFELTDPNSDVDKNIQNFIETNLLFYSGNPYQFGHADSTLTQLSLVPYPPSDAFKSYMSYGATTNSSEIKALINQFDSVATGNPVISGAFDVIVKLTHSGSPGFVVLIGNDGSSIAQSAASAQSLKALGFNIITIGYTSDADFSSLASENDWAFKIGQVSDELSVAMQIGNILNSTYCLQGSTSVAPMTSPTVPATSSSAAPVTSTVAPVTSTVAPSSSSTAPASSSAAPTSSSTAPVTSSAAPVSSSAAPASSSTAPASSSAAPISSSAAPVSSSAAPVSSSAAPASSSIAPASSSAAPISSSVAPASSSTAPVTSSAAPVSSSAAPASSSAGPASSSAAPSSSSVAPASSSVAPASSSTAPVTSSAAPVSSSAAPASSSTAPASSSVAPVTTVGPSSTLPQSSSTVPQPSSTQSGSSSSIGSTVTLPGSSSTVVQSSSTQSASSSSIGSTVTIPGSSSTEAPQSSTQSGSSSSTGSTVPGSSSTVPQPSSTQSGSSSSPGSTVTVSGSSSTVTPQITTLSASSSVAPTSTESPTSTVPTTLGSTTSQLCPNQQVVYQGQIGVIFELTSSSQQPVINAFVENILLNSNFYGLALDNLTGENRTLVSAIPYPSTSKYNVQGYGIARSQADFNSQVEAFNAVIQPVTSDSDLAEALLYVANRPTPGTSPSALIIVGNNATFIDSVSSTLARTLRNMKYTIFTVAVGDNAANLAGLSSGPDYSFIGNSQQIADQIAQKLETSSPVLYCPPPTPSTLPPTTTTAPSTSTAPVTSTVTSTTTVTTAKPTVGPCQCAGRWVYNGDLAIAFEFVQGSVGSQSVVNFLNNTLLKNPDSYGLTNDVNGNQPSKLLLVPYPQTDNYQLVNYGDIHSPGDIDQIIDAYQIIQSIDTDPSIDDALQYIKTNPGKSAVHAVLLVASNSTDVPNAVDTATYLKNAGYLVITVAQTASAADFTPLASGSQYSLQIGEGKDDDVAAQIASLLLDKSFVCFNDGSITAAPTTRCPATQGTTQSGVSSTTTASATTAPASSSTSAESSTVTDSGSSTQAPASVSTASASSTVTDSGSSTTGSTGSTESSQSSTTTSGSSTETPETISTDSGSSTTGFTGSSTSQPSTATSGSSTPSPATLSTDSGSSTVTDSGSSTTGFTGSTVTDSGSSTQAASSSTASGSSTVPTSGSSTTQEISSTTPISTTTPIPPCDAPYSGKIAVVFELNGHQTDVKNVTAFVRDNLYNSDNFNFSTVTNAVSVPYAETDHYADSILTYDGAKSLNDLQTNIDTLSYNAVLTTGTTISDGLIWLYQNRPPGTTKAVLVIVGMHADDDSVTTGVWLKSLRAQGYQVISVGVGASHADFSSLADKPEWYFQVGDSNGQFVADQISSILCHL